MNVWEFIHDKHLTSTRTILLYVLESSGSSPGRQGFKMAVAADGSFCGTIGGGIMEHKFVELAKSMLQKVVLIPAIYKQVHDKTETNDQSGMICSGAQTIFVYLVQDNDFPHIRQLIASLKKRKNGSLHLSNKGIIFSYDIASTNYHLELYNDDFLLIERTGFQNQIHIIGGGHCALALSKLMSGLDFYIHVYEEREGLNTVEQNAFAHQVTYVTSYRQLAELVPQGDNIYVIIMTVGYRTDDVALRSLFGKKLKYIGMLGSRKKIDKMLKDHSLEENDNWHPDHLFAPVGIQIKSQTSAEIAVSIAAQIIEIKNKDQ